MVNKMVCEYPIQNVRNLHLNDDVIEAVKKRNFIYMLLILLKKGIEILTGIPAGKER